jgi:hypothetical protein
MLPESSYTQSSTLMMETAGFSGTMVPVHKLHTAASQKKEIFVTAE